MSYPPPPDLKSPPISSTSTPQPHPSLPARPPPLVSASFKPAFSAAPSSTSGAPGTASFAPGQHPSTPSDSFAGFQPRSVAGSTQDWRNHTPSVPAGQTNPSSNYSHDSYQQQQYGYPRQQPQYFQQYGTESYARPTPPQIRNPFPLPGQAAQLGSAQDGRDGLNNADYDPDMEAQIAQWQSAYAAKDESTVQKGGSGTTGPQPIGGANAVAIGSRSGQSSATLTNQEVASAAKPDSGVAAVVSGPDGKQKTVVRSGGGETWQDATLLEWDPNHFRLFVGNLAGEVTDDSLLKAFTKYGSVEKARVVRDKRTTKSKGYGFVSFSNADQYFQAAKDMQGKYIGSHPVLLRRSTTEIRPTIPADKNKKNKGGKGGNTNGANTGAGISKKQAKTKGGLRLLG